MNSTSCSKGKLCHLPESLRLARSDRVDDEQYKMTEGQVVSFTRKCSYDSRHSQILLSTTTDAKRESSYYLRLLDAEGVGTLVCLILKTDENQFKMNRNKKAVI